MLGVIECKDFKRRVGTPEVDAFVTKASDVNANFKILMSRSGFTKPALEKCFHYGIKALSLIEDDPANKRFYIGTRWTADVRSWKKFGLALHGSALGDIENFSIEQVKINNKRIIDGFTNYLLDNEKEYLDLEGVVQVETVFEVPQSVEIRPGIERICTAVSFEALRVCEKLEYRVEIFGAGFYNWNAKEVTYPPGTTIATEGVPMDFSQWKPRSDATWKQSGFIEAHLAVYEKNLLRVEDALDLDAL
jgi:hypothetical protein